VNFKYILKRKPFQSSI